MNRNIQKIIFAIVLVLISVGLYSSFSLLGLMRESQVVLVKDGSFSPAKLIVKKGTNVVFKNAGKRSHWPASDFHPTHGIYPEFDPQEGIVAGENWEFKFEKPGKWKYHDHLEPEARGIIIVE